MKSYNLYWNNKTVEPQAIRMGFNSFAFIFLFFYPLYKGLWKLSLIYLLGYVSIISLSMFFGFNPIFYFVLRFLYSLFVGFDFSDAVCSDYHKSKDIQFVDSIFTTNQDHAEFLAFQKHVNSLHIKT